MKKIRIAILGAGISGLSTAYFLQQKYKKGVQVEVFEKASSPGGWIQSGEEKGALFEYGPRGFRPQGQGIETLKLALSLGLESQLCCCDIKAKRRYILGPSKELFALPHSLMSLGAFPYKWPLAVSFIKDILQRQKFNDDVSVEQLFLSHLHPKLVENIVDPFFLGIYGGDIRFASAGFCFSQLVKKHQEWGSWFKAFWRQSKKPISLPHSSSPLLSFNRGMHTLVQALIKNLGPCVHIQSSICGLSPLKRGVRVHRGNKEEDFQWVVSTLPYHDLAELLPSRSPQLSLQYRSIRQLHLLLGKDSFPSFYKGFGYLVPSYHQLPLMGCLFDSYIFPSLYENSCYPKLTLMFRGDEEVQGWSENNLLSKGLEYLKQHLKSTIKVEAYQVKNTYQALPQYPVHYPAQVEAFVLALGKTLPHLEVSGAMRSGVAVNACVDHAKKWVDKSNFFSSPFLGGLPAIAS